MANYTAADVKKLRELTQAGMMDCKKALDESDGNFDKAVELLRVKGAAKAAARAAERADANKIGDAEALKAVSLGDSTVGETVEELARTIGEKIELGEVAYFEG